MTPSRIFRVAPGSVFGVKMTLQGRAISIDADIRLQFFIRFFEEVHEKNIADVTNFNFR